MQWTSLAFGLVCILANSTTSAQSEPAIALDYGYVVSGDERIRPVTVFNDGRDTYIKPDPSQLQSLRILDAPYIKRAEHVVVPGMSRILRIEYRGAIAIARRVAPQPASHAATPALPIAVANAAAAVAARTDCAQNTRTEEQEYDVAFRAQRALPLRAFQNKLKRIVSAAMHANSITIVSIPENNDRALAEQRARYLRDALIVNGVSADTIRIDTQFRAGSGSQILIRRNVPSCGELDSDADTTALALAEPMYGVKIATAAQVTPLFHGHGAARARERLQSAEVVQAVAKEGVEDVKRFPRPNNEPSAQPVAVVAVSPVGDGAVSEPSFSRRRLVFSPNSSVREALRKYLRDEGVELDWQVSGDLIVEEYADVSGNDMKSVVTNALRRLGLRGTLIAGRRLIVATAGSL